MTTPCSVLLYTKNVSQARRVFSAIEKNTRRLEKKYNFFSSDSLIAKINNRNKPELFIDEETHNVLSKVVALSARTEGKFDITMGTLKQCSKLSGINEVEACRSRLRPFTGPSSWHLEAKKICFHNEHVKIDLGGVIKEYAVDQAGEIARKNKLSALINFGGDIYVNGTKPDGSVFGVAIKNPKQKTQNIAVIKLCNQGLTTSAHYERSTVIEGKSYSHIVGSDESDCKVLSATVVSDSVLTSGVWSTALMIKPDLNVSEDVSVILIDENLKVYQNIHA